MALNAATIWEVRTTGSDSSGGGFAVAGNTYTITDLAGVGANTSSPTVSSSTYTFVTGDANNYVYIASGTNWIPGFYKIVSAVGGIATLNAACATVGTPSSGSATVDYSQNNSAKVTFNGTTITATTVGAGATITISGYTVAASDVGNILQITGGTNYTTGLYQIISLSVGSNTWTLDRNVTTGAGAAMAGAMGGAFLTPVKGAASVVNSNTLWIGGGTYNTTTKVNFSNSGTAPSSTVPPTRVIGYYQTRGDLYFGSANNANRPLIQATGAIGDALIQTNTAIGFLIKNIQAVINGGSALIGINNAGGDSLTINCLVNGAFSTFGMVVGNPGITAFCEVTNVANSGIVSSNNGYIYGCYSHGNSGPGFNTNGNTNFLRDCISANNTGGSSDGFSIIGPAASVVNCIAYNNGRHGIGFTGPVLPYLLLNNILANNAGYGISNVTANGLAASEIMDGNAYYANTSGTTNNVSNTTGVYNSGPYINSHDVILTSSPFVNAGGGDFRLNQNPGGGAACRSAGVPSIYPGFSSPNSQSYIDMGAVQHQDPGFAG